MSFLSDSSPKPDKDTKRVAWNKAWEDELQTYRRFGNLKAFHTSIPPALRALANSPELILQLDKQSDYIITLQKDIREFALEKLATDNFGEKWKAMAKPRREELILEAFYQVACIAKDIEEHRKWCPEMTVKELAGNEGEEFLRLVRLVITDDPSVPQKKPIQFPNVLFDRLYNEEGMGSIVHGFQLNRCYYISLFIWRVFLIFYNKTEQTVLAKPLNATKEGIKAMKAANVETFGKEKAKVVQKAAMERAAEQVPVCWNCGVDQSRLGSEKILRACVRCKGIGRTILYCSKECQTNDWKNGRPRSHKSICGQKQVERQPDMQPPVAESGGSEDGPWIPEPDPGFQRSPALLYQINLLKENPNFEYVLTRPAPHPDIGVQFGRKLYRYSDDWISTQYQHADALGNMMFLMSRKRAMQNGDPRCIHEMYDFLAQIAKEYGISAPEVQKQLEREYGVKIVPKDKSPK